MAWFDLTTTDLAKSKDYYAKLFGWTFSPVQGTDLAAEIVARGAAIGTLRIAEESADAVSSAFRVTDIQAACKRAQGSERHWRPDSRSTCQTALARSDSSWIQRATRWVCLENADPAVALMFVIELIYKVPLAQIDEGMAAHVRFLKKHYAAGHFVASGEDPRDGGIILAVGASRSRIEAICATIPSARGLADIRVIEFRVSQRAADIQARIDARAPREARGAPR